MKKRIAIIDCALHRGGAEVSIELYIEKHLEDYDFVLFVPHNSKIMTSINKKEISLNENVFIQNKHGIFAIIGFFKLLFYGINNRFENTIITNTFKAHIIGLGNKIRNKNIEWIIMERDVPENIIIKIFKYFIHKKADKIIFNSQFLRKQYYQINNSEIVYNIIKKNRKKFEKEKTLFLYVGDITYSKGFDRVIEVFNKLKINNKRLIVLGNIPEYDKKIKILKSENIEYKGYVNPEEYYAKASYITLFNRKKESYSRVIAEAMEFDVIPIILKGNGMDDYVNEENGLMFDDFNIENIVKRIEEYINV